MISEWSKRYPAIGNDEYTEEQREAVLRQAQIEQQKIALAKADALVDLFKAAGRRYEKCTLEGFEAKTPAQVDVVRRLRDFANGLEGHVQQGDGLILYGPCGTGKDHLLVSLARLAILKGSSLLWVNGLDFFASARDAIARQEPEDRFIRRFAGPDVLCLSDPVPPVLEASERSRGVLTDYQSQMLHRVIDRRYRDRKCTWVTVNVASSKELADRIGTPAMDRLRDGAVAIQCNWESYRRAK